MACTLNWLQALAFVDFALVRGRMFGKVWLSLTDPRVRARVQMAPLVNFTKLKTIPKDVLGEFCVPLKSVDKQSLGVMEYCYPDAMKKAKEICSRHKDDGKGDDKNGGKGQQKPHVHT